MVESSLCGLVKGEMEPHQIILNPDYRADQSNGFLGFACSQPQSNGEQVWLMTVKLLQVPIHLMC